MNFYTWIRDGVRRAVLLGVSDAIEQIGTPDANPNGEQVFLTRLRQGIALETHDAVAIAAPADETHEPAARGRSGKSKRLGRSLDQLAADRKVA